jgi:hypothetical protein
MNFYGEEKSTKKVLSRWLFFKGREDLTIQMRAKKEVKQP